MSHHETHRELVWFMDQTRMLLAATPDEYEWTVEELELIVDLKRAAQSLADRATQTLAIFQGR